MDEKRKFRRLQIKEKTTLNKDTCEEQCFLVDISPGGMKVLLENEVKVGDCISGQFKILPKAGPFFVKGTVAWVRPIKEKSQDANYEIGIKFTKINTIPF